LSLSLFSSLLFSSLLFSLSLSHSLSLRIGGEFAEIERWFYQGIGSTTYYTPTAFRPPPAKGGEKGAAGAGKVAVAQPKKGGGWIQWSQRDLHGILGLTDREKLRLRQM
jgi:hypothetical protein